MSHQESSEEIADRYREAARQLVDRYSWQLVTPDELVESALALIADGEAKNFTKALVGAYCIVMYWAFVGKQGAERQRRACDELGRTFSRLLIRNYRDLPLDEREDVTQNALERVWRARESCREPTAFLAFAASHLLSAVQLTRRQLRRIGDSWEHPIRPDNEQFDTPDGAPPLLVQVLDKQRSSDIVRFLDELRRTHKRAKNQIDVLELRCLEDLHYPEIADRLKISQKTAHSRLWRICKTIREDPELSRRARDLGLHELD